MSHDACLSVGAAAHGNTPPGMTARSLRIAIRYWASYPDEIDAEIVAAEAADEAAEQAWRRERRMLAG